MSEEWKKTDLLC